MRGHTWVNPIFFLETITSIEPLIQGKCAPKTYFLAFIQPAWRLLRKKFHSCIRYLVSPPKKVILIFVIRRLFPEKWSCPPKIIFNGSFGFFFFSEKIVIWKIFKTSFRTKKFILIFVTRHRLPLKMVMSSHKWVFTIFLTSIEEYLQGLPAWK